MSLSYKIRFYSLVFLLSIVGLAVFGDNRVQAASPPPGYYTAPSRIGADGRTATDNPNYINFSNSSNDGTGVGGLLREITVKVYTPANSTRTAEDRTVFIDLLQRGGGKPCDYTMTAQAKQDNVNTWSNLGTQPGAGCGRLSWTISDSDIYWRDGTNAEGLAGLKIAIVRITMNFAGDNANAPVNYVGVSGDSKVGFMGGFGVPIRSTQGTTNGVTYNLAFGVPCNANSGSVPPSVSWADDDWFTGSTVEESNFRVVMINPGTGNKVGGDSNTNRTVRSAAPNSRDAIQSMAVTLTPGQNYDWKFLQVDDGNTISAYYPYDSFQYFIDCKPRAECSISITSGPLVPGRSYPAVRGSQQYTANIAISNTGPVDIPGTSVEGNRLSLSGWGGFGDNPHYIPGIPFGGSANYSFNFSSPGYGAASWAGVQGSNRVAERYVDYWGKGGISPACNLTTNIYEEFYIRPTASQPIADTENPDPISWSTGGDKQYGPYDISSTGYSTLYRANSSGTALGSALAQINRTPARSYSTYTYPQDTYDDAYDGRVIRLGEIWAPGDKICVSMRIDTSRGWAGPQGDLASVTPSTAEGTCSTVVNKPYVRFYGQDVFAGGNFPNSTRQEGRISTNYRATAIGSGVEYAAFALGAISGFGSNDLQVDSTFDTLNFASSPKGSFGGDHIATDYFSKKPDNTTVLPAISSVDISTLVDKTSYYKNTGGAVYTLTNTAPFVGSKTLYIEGDVYISNNIEYAPWGANIDDIPSFRLVVKGNIYIAPGVTRIDGMLVAQPTNASGNNGTISTCATSTGANANLTSNGTVGECAQKLVINGAIVAQKIKWLRTYKTLSDAGSGGREPYNNNNAAEVINTSPDFYLGIPAGPPTGGGTSGKYDSYQALPPIL